MNEMKRMIMSEFFFCEESVGLRRVLVGKRIIAVIKAANTLGLSFSEAFNKQPTELLQLLSLKAQDSFEEANFLVQTHPMPAASIAQILAESFLKVWFIILFQF